MALAIVDDVTTEDMMSTFEPTHVITVKSLGRSEKTYVRSGTTDKDGAPVGFGPLYTKEEWESGAPPAWELTDEGLLRNGYLIDGAVCNPVA